MNAAMALYDRIVDKNLLVRRVYITANHVAEESGAAKQECFEQMDRLFWWMEREFLFTV